MTSHVSSIPKSRLVDECKHLRIDTTGASRSELVNALLAVGCENIDLRFPAKPPKIDNSKRDDDLSNLFLGNGAGFHEQGSNKLYIANNATTSPLIGGDFNQHRVTINHMLHVESCPFAATEHGSEGDIRRDDDQLYMFRSSGVIPGWYPFLFGIVKII